MIHRFFHWFHLQLEHAVVAAVGGGQVGVFQEKLKQFFFIMGCGLSHAGQGQRVIDISSGLEQYGRKSPVNRFNPLVFSISSSNKGEGRPDVTAHTDSDNLL